MKRSLTNSLLPLVVLTAALGLGACGRTQKVTEPASAGRGGAGTQVVAGCPTVVGNTFATAFDFNTDFASVAQFRPGNRIRIESVGDLPQWSIEASGPCAAADIPSINFIGGHANVFLSGTTTSITQSGGRLTFGALLFPGAALEEGVVLASDAAGNVLEIIWPGLAGLPPGPPRIRVQLAAWNDALVTATTKLDIVWDMTAEQDGIQSTFKGHCEGMAMDGTPVVPGGAAIPPCPATIAGTSGLVNVLIADVVQFRNNRRIRIEARGDVASGTVNLVGACAAADAPAVSFVGGSANVFQAGTNVSVTSTGSALTFGALLFPGALLEPGVVLASDVNKNVLEIVWPGLAGLPPGAPVFRLQLARWNAWIRTGRRIDVQMQFDARATDGSTASYNVVAPGILMPQAR